MNLECVDILRWCIARGWTLKGSRGQLEDRIELAASQRDTDRGFTRQLKRNVVPSVQKVSSDLKYDRHDSLSSEAVRTSPSSVVTAGSWTRLMKWTEQMAEDKAQQEKAQPKGSEDGVSHEDADCRGRCRAADQQPDYGEREDNGE